MGSTDFERRACCLSQILKLPGGHKPSVGNGSQETAGPVQRRPWSRKTAAATCIGSQAVSPPRTRWCRVGSPMCVRAGEVCAAINQCGEPPRRRTCCL